MEDIVRNRRMSGEHLAAIADMRNKAAAYFPNSGEEEPMSREAVRQGRDASSETGFRLAQDLEGQVRMEEAIGAWRNVAESAEAKDEKAVAFRAWCQRAYLLMASSFEDAIIDFDKAIALDSRNATAFYNRGTSKAGLGLHEAAISDFDKAINLDSKQTVAYYSRGNSKVSLNRRREAIVDYDKAIGLDPTFGAAYQNRGACMLALGRHEEAVRDLKAALDLARGSDTAI